MNDILGQFLRFLHLIMMCVINEEGQRAKYYPTNKGDDAVPPDGEFFDRLTYI
jgi:hypothetical protein